MTTTTATANIATLRRILFTVLNDGNPTRGGDAWVTDSATVKAFYPSLSMLEAEEVATEARVEFVEAVEAAIAKVKSA